MAQQTANTTRDSLKAVMTKLDEVINEARSHVGDSDPKAQALFETTAEVAIGLKKAYEDYSKGSEQAWQ